MAILRILPTNAKAAALAIFASVVGCTVGTLAVDAAFRNSLSPAYVASFTSPHQVATTMVYMTKAARDEVARLVVLGGMLGSSAWLLRGREIGLPAVLVMAIAAQLVILLPQLAMPANITGLVYCAIRYVGPGVLWGWLFWRHGFVAALLGHTLRHPILDPLLHAMLEAH